MMSKVAVCLSSLAFTCVLYAGKLVALMGFGTDVKVMKSDVTDQCRYASEVFVDKWVPPADYGKYSVLYFGEKLRGEAKGMNWREGEARTAAERFIAGGGTVIVAGKAVMTDRVFEFMNRVTERVTEVHPDKLLSTYA